MISYPMKTNITYITYITYIDESVKMLDKLIHRMINIYPCSSFIDPSMKYKVYEPKPRSPKDLISELCSPKDFKLKPYNSKNSRVKLPSSKNPRTKQYKSYR
jgi:hypothetical protein